MMHYFITLYESYVLTSPFYDAYTLHEIERRKEDGGGEGIETYV